MYLISRLLVRVKTGGCLQIKWGVAVFGGQFDRHLSLTRNQWEADRQDLLVCNAAIKLSSAFFLYYKTGKALDVTLPEYDLSPLGKSVIFCNKGLSASFMKSQVATWLIYLLT